MSWTVGIYPSPTIRLSDPRKLRTARIHIRAVKKLPAVCVTHSLINSHFALLFIRSTFPKHI